MKQVNESELLLPSLGGITKVFIVAAGLYFGADFFIPLAISFILFLLFSPIVNTLSGEGSKARKWLVTVLLMIGLTTALFSAMYYMATPTYNFFKTASKNLDRVQRELVFIKGSMPTLEKAQKTVDDISKSRTTPEAAEQISKSPIRDELLAIIQGLLRYFALIGFLLIFFLVYGDDLIRSSWRSFGSTPKGFEMSHLLKRVKKAMGRYLLTVTAINFLLGVAIAGGLYIYGFKNPIIWGFLAMSLNFIPYLGAIVGSSLALVFGYAMFGTLFAGFVPAAIYFGINTIEGQMITPLILGSTFKINPLVILLVMLIGGFLWGLIGLFLAVPFLVISQLMLEEQNDIYKRLENEEVKEST